MKFRLHQISLCVALGLGLPMLAAGQSATSPVSAKTGRYRNPLLPEQMADPHVVKVGPVYYLYATTHTRGYEVYTSTNLVNWTKAGEAFVDPRGGAWAPDVFHNERGDGNYYLYYTDSAPDRRVKQIGVAVSKSPLGPFEDRRVIVTNAIDAHLFQDDNGSNYFYYVDLSDGFKIRGQAMPDLQHPIGEAKVLIYPTEDWEQRSGRVTEGPFVLKRNQTYYLMFSGSGADSPFYGIGFATSSSPLGPFRKYPGNPIVRSGGKVIGPGHHCVVTGPDGKLWLVYHQKWTEERGWQRFLAIDPLEFDAKGVLHATATRDTDQPAPRTSPQR